MFKERQISKIEGYGQRRAITKGFQWLKRHANSSSMHPSEVPWIDEPGYWHKKLLVGNGPDDFIVMEVGARVKADGGLKFKAMTNTPAVVRTVGSAIRLREYDTLEEAKQACDDVALDTRLKFIPSPP